MFWSATLLFSFVNKLSLVNNTVKSTVMPYYAVARGRTPGIFMTWADCEAQVKGFSGAKYKKFDSVQSAQEFITSGGGGNQAASKAIPAKTITKQQNNNNLKRPYSTTAQTFSNRKSIPSDGYSKNRSKKNHNESNESYNDHTDSDDSDDLNTILMKQMDDIEKRVKGFSEGIDKIIKKSSKGKKSILIEPPQPKRMKNGRNGFETDSDGFVQVYTDGACSSNGRSGAKAGLGVYWGDNHDLNISEPVSGRATNNCGEIQAATRAIQVALENGVDKLSINTDSQFLINAVTKWMSGWKRKGWKLQSGEPVKNEIDFKELDSLQNKLSVKWNYVEAHRGVHGNEMADQLAKAGASQYNK